MTQDDYKIWTGESISLSDDEWMALVTVAESRLMSLLCLNALPEDGDGKLPQDFRMLLANFICATLKFRGNPEAGISSKSVRNFTISFSTNDAASAFAQIARNYKDIIASYSECGLGFSVEKSKTDRCHDCF